MSTKPVKKALHLGETEFELALFDFQHGALCYIEAFHRHITNQLFRITGNASLSAPDCVVLHAIRLGDRPKSIPELQHFTNRSDLANVQYSVKKLIEAKLVGKSQANGTRGTTYELTAYGREVTDEYVAARKADAAMIPYDSATLMSDLKAASRIMLVLTGMYDHASRTETAR